jgi:hypothetical protein
MNPTPPPIEPSSFYLLSGYWERSTKGRASWVAAIVGAREGRLTLAFLKAETIDWQSKKGDPQPRGIKRWVLVDGLYKAALLESAEAPKQYQLFAVTGGQRREVSEEEVLTILQQRKQEEARL